MPTQETRRPSPEISQDSEQPGNDCLDLAMKELNQRADAELDQLTCEIDNLSPIIKKNPADLSYQQFARHEQLSSEISTIRQALEVIKSRSYTDEVDFLVHRSCECVLSAVICELSQSIRDQFKDQRDIYKYYIDLHFFTSIVGHTTIVGDKSFKELYSKKTPKLSSRQAIDALLTIEHIANLDKPCFVPSNEEFAEAKKNFPVLTERNQKVFCDEFQLFYILASSVSQPEYYHQLKNLIGQLGISPSLKKRTLEVCDRLYKLCNQLYNKFQSTITQPGSEEFSYAIQQLELFLDNNATSLWNLLINLGIRRNTDITTLYRLSREHVRAGESVEFWQNLGDEIKNDTLIFISNEQLQAIFGDEFEDAISPAEKSFADLSQTLKKLTSLRTDRSYQSEMIYSGSPDEELYWNPDFIDLVFEHSGMQIYVALKTSNDSDEEVIIYCLIDCRKGKQYFDWSILEDPNLPHLEPIKKLFISVIAHFLEDIEIEAQNERQKKLQRKDTITTRPEPAMKFRTKRVSGGEVAKAPDARSAKVFMQSSDRKESRAIERAPEPRYTVIQPASEDMSVLLSKFGKSKEKIRDRVEGFIERINRDQTARFKKLAGLSEEGNPFFRLRMGQIRIILEQLPNNHYVIERVTFRKNAY